MTNGIVAALRNGSMILKRDFLMRRIVPVHVIVVLIMVVIIQIINRRLRVIRIHANTSRRINDVHLMLKATRSERFFQRRNSANEGHDVSFNYRANVALNLGRGRAVNALNSVSDHSINRRFRALSFVRIR